LVNLAKYFFVGGFCFLIDFSIFFYYAKLNDYNYLLVNLISFSIATFTNYILCIFFVFESGLKYNKKTEILLVFFVSGSSLAVSQSILYILVSILNLEIMISKIISIICTFLMNYFGRSSFVFSRKR